MEIKQRIHINWKVIILLLSIIFIGIIFTSVISNKSTGKVSTKVETPAIQKNETPPFKKVTISQLSQYKHQIIDTQGVITRKIFVPNSKYQGGDAYFFVIHNLTSNALAMLVPKTKQGNDEVTIYKQFSIGDKVSIIGIPGDSFNSSCGKLGMKKICEALGNEDLKIPIIIAFPGKYYNNELTIKLLSGVVPTSTTTR